MSAPLPLLIVHWNRPDACIGAAASFHTQGIPVDITILDNGSAAASLAKLRVGVAGLAAVRELGGNLGFGPALNVGLREWLATGDAPFIAVAAHDALPHPECLARLLEVMGERSHCGIVSAETGQSHIARFTGLRGPYLPHHARSSGFSAQDFPHGTLFLLRRACLSAIGVFDERYFAYGCEMDIGMRARSAGWEVGACLGALVDNPERSVAGEVASYLQLRNAIVLVRVWKGTGWALWRSAIALGNTVRLALVARDRPQAWSTRSRLFAVLHAWTGRCGPPPTRLTAAAKDV